MFAAASVFYWVGFAVFFVWYVRKAYAESLLFNPLITGFFGFLIIASAYGLWKGIKDSLQYEKALKERLAKLERAEQRTATARDPVRANRAGGDGAAPGSRSSAGQASRASARNID